MKSLKEFRPLIKLVKEDLNKLYALSKYRKFTICAPDDDSLNNIIEELTKRGFVYNEWNRN